MKPNEVSERAALHLMRVIVPLVLAFVVGLCVATSLLAMVLR